jgi:hypothetical protein
MVKLTKKQELNYEKRMKKKMRIKERKANGTYIYIKKTKVINKWGKPFYELVKEELPWVKIRYNRSRIYYWRNPITNKIVNSFDISEDPKAHIHYKWVSTGKFSDIKPVSYTTKVNPIIEDKK